MRTTEAARYARWSAGIAVLLVVLVACVYGARDWQSRQARKKVPAAVPSSVEQRSAGFSCSKVVGDRTEFTVRASRATEFVEGGRSLLEDVWITAYGGAGERFDNLHTRTCDYLTALESISCAGDVQIDLDRSSDQHTRAGQAEQASGSGLVQVATSHVSFDHKTGLATTDRPARFRFSQGEGQGAGCRYEGQPGESRRSSPKARCTRLPETQTVTINWKRIAWKRNSIRSPISRGCSSPPEKSSGIQTGLAWCEIWKHRFCTWISLPPRREARRG